MRFPWFALLVVGCTDPSPLGGQEGEPLAPAAPPPPDMVDDGVDADACQVVAHCAGDGWCVQYGDASLPDLDEVCEGAWAEGPCDATGATGSCSAPGADACTTVWVWDPLVPADFCAESGFEAAE
jgi:hypothetical protein